MSVQQIKPSYLTFQDIDGQPLENGSIYIGTPGLDAKGFPIQAYWDAAKTLPITQPVKTLNGFPANNGTPANIYADNTDYSLVVENKKGTTVYSSLNSSERFGSRTSNAKLADVVSVKDYGAFGDGASDDTVAIQAAIDDMTGKGALYFPRGVYVVSSLTIPQAAGIVAPISIYGENERESVIRFTGTGSGNLLYMNAQSNCNFRDLGIEYNSTSFTGTVFKIFQTARCEFTNMMFNGFNEGDPGGVRTALYLVDLDESIEILFNRCRFSGAQYLVRGQDEDGGGFANAIQFNCCDFDGYTAGAIRNVGQGWVIQGCAFENRVDGAGNAIQQDTLAIAMGLVFQGNWLGDATANIAYIWINIHGTGITITGNYINGHGFGIATAIAIPEATSGLVITGNRISSFGTGINAGSLLVTSSMILGNAFIGVGSDLTGTLGAQTAEYEEGTWTPDLRFGGGVTGITYTSRSGSYIIDGRRITVAWDIVLSSKGTDTGNAQVYGLPLTSSGIVGQIFDVGYQENMTAAIDFMSRIEDSNTIATFAKPSGTGVVALTDADFTNTTRISGSCTYIAQ